jgi:hypothetical protein
VSLYVLCELGARWAIGGYFAPILGPGSSYKLLEGPLAQCHKLKLSERTDMQQLLEEIALATDHSLQPAQSYEHELEALIAASLTSENSISTENKEVEIIQGEPCPRCFKKGWHMG